MNYHNITYPDMNNGEGLRVVLWLSGCSHKCKGCQNPQTWDANSGIPFDESAKEELFRELDKDYISGLTLTGGDPLFESNLDSVLDLVTEVNKRYNTVQDTVYVKDKNNNICTDFNHEICLSCPKKSIWIYSGYQWEDIFDGIFCQGFQNYEKLNQLRLKRKDIVSQSTVMIDGQYIDFQRNLSIPWCGSENQRVIDIQKTLQLHSLKGQIVLWQI